MKTTTHFRCRAREITTEAQDALSTPSNVYGMFSNADLEFEDAEIKMVKTSINTRNFYQIFRI